MVASSRPVDFLRSKSGVGQGGEESGIIHPWKWSLPVFPIKSWLACRLPVGTSMTKLGWVNLGNAIDFEKPELGG